NDSCISVYHHKKLDRDYYRIRILSKQIVQDLAQYGIINNKTYNLDYIKISKEFENSLVRGWFDGDGCIYKGKYGGVFSIIGTREVIEGFSKVFLELDIKTS